MHKTSVHLSQGQKQKLARPYRNNEGVTIHLLKSALSGSDVLMVPNNTVKKLAKHRNAGKEMEITILKKNTRKQSGKEIFSAVLPVAPALGKTLGLSALAGAANERACEIMKKKNSGGQIFRIPNDKLFMLAQMSNLLTSKQRRDLAEAHQLMGDMNFSVTGKQVSNGIGTLLASIGIPLAIEAVKKLTGRGIRRGSSMLIGNRGGESPRIRRPLPFIGTWKGRGKKRPERSESLTRKKSPFNSIPLIGAIL